MTHRIVVLGAGYAGVLAAQRLARRTYRDEVEIHLVNAVPHFVERIRMHQLVVGQDLEQLDLRALLVGSGIHLQVATVESVHPDRHQVLLADGSEIGYDTLIYALGSTTARPPVPGLDEHAENIATEPAATVTREGIRRLDAGPVVIIGAGLTGVELAAEIAESRPGLSVQLVEQGEVGGWLSAAGRHHVRRVLKDLGVTLLDHVSVTRVRADAVELADGRSLTSALTIWAGGFDVHPMAARSVLDTTRAGRIKVDRSMRSLSHPDVYAVGDAASVLGPGDHPMRMACGSGVPMAWQAAESLAARLSGHAVPTTPLLFVAQNLSLGRRAGLIQLVRPDDSMRSLVVTGRLAAWVKESVCRGAVSILRHPAPYPTWRRRVGSAQESVNA